MPSKEAMLAPMVRKLALRAPIDAMDSQAILALPFTRRVMDPSTYLVREGDLPDQCAVIVSGFAFRQKITGGGARAIISLHIPGEILDLQHLVLDVADHNVQTLSSAMIATVPRSALRELARSHPGVAHAMTVNILVEASIFREWVVNVGRRDARARIAHLLCEFAIRLDKQGISAGQDYELPMTQEQLADAVGLTPVHVNRTLKLLEQDGLITRDKRKLAFPRWEALKAISDFSSRYLHLAQQIA